MPAVPVPAEGHENRIRQVDLGDEAEATKPAAAPKPSVSTAASEPKASHEDIDAALAEWYFEPYSGKDGEEGEDAEPSEAASAAPAAAPALEADEDEDERLLGGGPIGGPADDLDSIGGYESPRTVDEVRDARPAAASPEPAATASETAASQPAASQDAAAAASASHGFTAAQAADPATPAATLHRIAAEAPELHAQLAKNPALYQDLRDWLSNSPDPEVQQALAERDDR
ncbi:hypothetical protein USB125703_01214 [Pseudoclavibacter triregionum]|nr:hypothetical protein USB125703_01214 [Pseudoclavibacter triregionum]